MIPDKWLGKPYYSLDAFCKEKYGYKCYKIALDAGMSCPNRDGTLGSGGCIFCSGGGSGEFAACGDSIQSQLEKGLALFGDKKIGNHYIAYFQSYTNTYAPVSRLKALFTEALEHPDVCGISIATRPDCLPEEILSLLSELKERFPQKFIWIELGLQTIHASTANFIRRGYPLSTFSDTAKRLNELGIPYIVHLILGLPGETKDMVYESISYLNQYNPFGVKLQLLHILKGTDLAPLYESGAVQVMEKEEYLDLLIGCMERLSPDIVIHRVTGDGPKDLLLAPTYSLNKRDMLNSLHKEMKIRGSYQGQQYGKQ